MSLRPPLPMPGTAPGWAFFLDIDGTLLEFAEHPSAVSVDADLKTLLARLLDATAGAVALISGRTVADLDALFAPLRFPAAGQHGAERRRADGTHHRSPALAGDLRPALRDLTDFAGDRPGVAVEDKGSSVAVHFRRRPELHAVVAEAVARSAATLGAAWVVQEGRLVFEIKPAGRDKGRAIAEFIAEPPFAGLRVAFVGDDLTDEHGFAVVNECGGVSVKVADGATTARWRLPDAAAVRAWLTACVEGLGVPRLQEVPRQPRP